MMELIASLSDAFGPPGLETEVRRTILAHLGLSPGSWSSDALGNLYVTNSPQKEVSLLLAAPIDEPGLFVTSHDDQGRCYFAPIGRLPHDNLHGCLAQLNGNIKGVFVKAGENWVIDIGAKDRTVAEKHVPVGTVGTVAASAHVMTAAQERITGKAMHRALSAVLLSVVKQTGLGEHWVAAFLAQQEPSGRGARVVGEHWRPERLITLELIDSTSEEGAALQVGAGPVLVLRAAHLCSDPHWASEVVAHAEAEHIPLQRFAGDLELPMSERLQVSGQGARLVCLGLPARYTDRVWQMVDLADAEKLARLLIALCRNSTETGSEL